MKRFVQIVVLLAFIGMAMAMRASAMPKGSAFEPATRRGRGAIDAINESSREIPVAYDVDVVVVGGTSGGVAAAVAAAREGASVFLAAQRPYLGEDLCGTYRLWLKPGETPISPLAKKIFAAPAVASLSRNRIGFTYEADKPSAGVHKDANPPSLLTDGKWQNAATQSVQYDGDVKIIAALGGERRLKKVHVMAYQRHSAGRGDDFGVESVAVSVSSDKRQWKQVAVIRNERSGQSLSTPSGLIELTAPVAEKAAYVRFDIKKSPGVNRVLLGEIVIEDERPHVESGEGLRIPPTPMQVKRTLDDELLGAGVQFLYGCYTTDVLRDGDGRLAGIVMANRSGRQAVRAKVVIDATPRATVARMAGATFSPYAAGPQTFKFVTVGADIRGRNGLKHRQMPVPIPALDGSSHQAVEYTLEIPMKDGSFASFAQAEQIARDKTWEPALEDSSDALFQVSPDPIKAKESVSGAWPGARSVNLGVFRPKGIDRLFVVGGCADVSRSAAENLLRPLELMTVGSRVGTAAAVQAKRTPELRSVRVRSTPAAAIRSGDVRENLSGIRSRPKQPLRVPADAGAVAVLGQYDVVVVGGGTGGAPAGIAAARQGAKTLVLEYLHGLGGVGTNGYICKYYYGYIRGFTKEVDDGVAALEHGRKPTGGGWNVECKKQWYRRELRKAGADIWFGVLGCGAFVENGHVKGVVVATPDGRGVVLARVVIDSTGNADIAAAAGAACVYTNGVSVAVQGAGLPPRKLGAGYTNTDWTFIDDGDVVDVWRAFVIAKEKYRDAYDLGKMVDTRERRRIVGDFTMSPMDITLGRTYPDTIAIARSNFDSHGYTVHPIFLLKPPDRKEILVNVPYRCLLPKGLGGILVTGLGVSAHRDAMPVIRMQADIQNQGYAAGVAAAMAVRTGKSVRDIDIRALQRHLVEKGNLPERVLTDKDSFPLPPKRISEAVDRLVNNFDGLDVVLSHLPQALPLLKSAYETAQTQQSKLAYAHVLGMLGEPLGAGTLAEAVRSQDWDKGWNYTGMGQYGASISELDSLIIALGRTRDKRAISPILEKIRQLDATSAFSHCRAVAMALETLGDASAARPLAELLSKPGMMGHAFTSIEQARRLTPSSDTDTKTRNDSLRELILARALYRCGDYNGVGERILKQYANDLRAHYARHASDVLHGKRG
jgi:flavin-dependent dehydrogenase